MENLTNIFQSKVCHF